jgi:hypothetical protein
MVEKLVVSGRVKATNVDVAISRNSVFEALVKALHLTCRSKDRRDRLRDSRALRQKLI